MTKAHSKRAHSSEGLISSSEIMPEQRQRMIAEAAYYIAEKRGFDGQYSLDNWLEAEQSIDEVIDQKFVV